MARSRPPALIPLLAAGLVAAVLAGLCAGAVTLTPADLLAALRGGDGDGLAATLLQLRLPRVLLAVLVGAALAQSGAITQALFRNPLAEPGLLGVSAGAALAAAAVFTLAATHAAWLLPLAAFGGAAAVTAAVVLLVRRAQATDLATLLLAGAAVNAFVAAGVGLLAALADDPGLRGFTLWMFGNLGRADWPQIAVAGPILAVLIVRLPFEARTLDALLLGEAEALHLGIDVEAAKRRLLAGVVLATACCVALAGMIGFVGLIVPHAIRLLAGPGHRRLLPAAALAGAALLVLTDTVARAAHPPLELPVGILTALLGAPVFLALLLKLRSAGR